jgi:hypothetical protein
MSAALFRETSAQRSDKNVKEMMIMKIFLQVLQREQGDVGEGSDRRDS